MPSAAASFGYIDANQKHVCLTTMPIRAVRRALAGETTYPNHCREALYHIALLLELQG
jgi:hypothetical protein